MYGDRGGRGYQDVQPIPKRRALTRECTDPMCCIAFSCCIAYLGYMWTSALQDGNIEILTHGIDWKGEICGVNKSVVSKPFLYWCVQDTTFPPQVYDGICVEECPQNETLTFQCPGDMHVEQKEIKADHTYMWKINRDLKEMASVPTDQVLGMYCVPKVKAVFEQVEKATGMGGLLQEISVGANGLLDSRYFIMTVTLLAALAGMLYLVVLAYFAKILVLVSLAIATTLLALVDAYFFLQVFGILPMAWIMGYFSTDTAWWLTVTVAVLLAAGLAAFICFALVARRGFDATIRALNESCRLLKREPTLTLMPFVNLVFKVFVILWVLCGVIYTFALADVEPINPLSMHQESFSGVTRHLHLATGEKIWLVIWVVMLVWILEWVAAWGQFAISHAVVEAQVHGGEWFPLISGYSNGLIFHAGSLALGSFIVGVLRILTMLTAFVGKRLQGNRSRDPTQAAVNQVTSAMCCCCSCALKCLSSIAEAVNEKAYTDIAINGTNYVDACHNVVKMCAAEPSAFLIMETATRVTRWLAVILIGGGGTFCSWCYLRMTRGTAFNKFIWMEIFDECFVAGLICFQIAFTLGSVMDHVSEAMMYADFSMKANLRRDQAQAYLQQQRGVYAREVVAVQDSGRAQQGEDGQCAYMPL